MAFSTSTGGVLDRTDPAALDALGEFLLDVQVTTEAVGHVSRGCDTSDTCGSTCASACASD